MNIAWLGHSAYRIQAPNATILIDPFLKNNPLFPQAHFDAIAAGTTHIALTHGDEDHLGDTIEIAAKSGAQVLCNEALGQRLAANGVENIVCANTGGTINLGNMSLTFVRAVHESANGPSNGLVFHFGQGKSVYHMGDTDIFGDMALINELHRPQIGIVPIGDKYTMGPAVAALAARRYFDFKTILPCHYGTMDDLEPNADRFIEAMEDAAKLVKVTPVGELIEI